MDASCTIHMALVSLLCFFSLSRSLALCSCQGALFRSLPIPENDIVSSNPAAVFPVSPVSPARGPVSASSSRFSPLRLHASASFAGFDLGLRSGFYSLASLPRKEVIQPHLPIRLPCYDFTPVIGLTFDGCSLAVRSPASGAPNSHGVTGGVYKARERIHRDMLIRDY